MKHKGKESGNTKKEIETNVLKIVYKICIKKYIIIGIRIERKLYNIYK